MKFTKPVWVQFAENKWQAKMAFSTYLEIEFNTIEYVCRMYLEFGYMEGKASELEKAKTQIYGAFKFYAENELKKLLEK